MSRIGKLSVVAPKGVDVKVANDFITVKGPKGELKMKLTDDVTVKVENSEVHVTPRDAEDRRSKAMWGTARANIQNMVVGVTTGFEKNLELVGVGYRAAMKGKDQLNLQIGFSHEVLHQVPKGVEVKVAGAKQEIITVTGIDKQLVGQVAADIRAYRPPEPYQGKGIRYKGEYVHRKEGKKK